MSIQVDFWQLVMLLLAFFGACAGAGGLLLRQTQTHLDERFNVQEATRTEHHRQLSTRLDGMEQVNRDETLQWQRIEREMLKRFGDLPHAYVMRDDYIRGQSILEAKLDGLAGKIENAHLRAVIKTNGAHQ